jgi:hypothetical protein
LWDPREAHSREDEDWRRRINDFRINLVLRLRENLGDTFVGGIARDRHSESVCPADLLVDQEQTNKRAYLLRAARSEIVVTTAGLHQSIGWRFGEALALGRPLVTEAFICELPGDLAEGRNFIAFSQPDEAADRILALQASPMSLLAMRESARSYYQEWLRPDVLVARTLAAVVEA